MRFLSMSMWEEWNDQRWVLSNHENGNFYRGAENCDHKRKFGLTGQLAGAGSRARGTDCHCRSSGGGPFLLGNVAWSGHWSGQQSVQGVAWLVYNCNKHLMEQSVMSWLWWGHHLHALLARPMQWSDHATLPRRNGPPPELRQWQPVPRARLPAPASWPVSPNFRLWSQFSAPL